VTSLPSRGEVWDGDLDPVTGHEQGGRRPLLIVSTDGFNHGLATLIFVVPITSKGRNVPAHIPINPPEGGLTNRSFILCDAMRSISKSRLLGRRGAVSQMTMDQVEDALRILLDL
jgi:mRNA interferase MazF